MARIKLIPILIILLLLPSSLCALMSHVGAPTNSSDQYAAGTPVPMSLYGFIDDGEPIFRIELSDPVFPGRGLNLDVMDASNDYRYQIAPSTEPLTLAGAIIGSFSVISSTTNKKITITHTPLLTETDSGTVAVDWELAVGWEIGGKPTKAFCLSTSDTSSGDTRKIEISLQGSGTDVIRIHDALMYFRLTSSHPVTVSGQYHASIIFEVETIEGANP